MRRIDRETVQKILDTADIVDVVSDFVSLKRRGANYIGLCPFHNERTPSFSVSRSKGICKCFSCGKGGSAVGFLMELEQLSYNEALRYLAKKYNIEIKDHEVSEEERERESERESMMAVNEFAMHYFEQTLTDTDDGRNIGLAYFQERGINQAMVKRFHLGYSLDRRDDLYRTATAKGFAEKFLIDTGLCYRTERGVNDRFRARVIYPVFTISGKVVAFGGRTLRKDKEVAKYVNSPESIIYRKSYELYGLYQAKQSIVKKDRCILVEGYMDVISMHQSGVENVVASSGTSLTEGQIRLIHRFTENVTVIYDSDPAGIKASLRGIDLLLAEGLNVKVLLLPDGDDPDSFAQTHSSAEVEDYIKEHSRDFIAFKTDILLKDAQGDPIARSRAIQSIVRSISMIPDAIVRTVYVGECARSLNIDEKVLHQQVVKYAAENAEKQSRDALRERNRAAAGLPANPADDPITPLQPPTQSGVTGRQTSPESATSDASDADRLKFLANYERDLVQYVVKFGTCHLCDVPVNDNGDTEPMSVLDYIIQEFETDCIAITNPDIAAVFNACMDAAAGWKAAREAESQKLLQQKQLFIAQGVEEIRQTADGDLMSIETRERELAARAEADYEAALADYAELFLQKQLASSQDDVVRRTATDMVTSRHSLSKIHTKYSKVATERERLTELVPLALYNLKCALIECNIKDNTRKMALHNSGSAADKAIVDELMAEIMNLNEIKKTLSLYLGERILSPRSPR
ncbi:MAG: DNA primase [Bacteroides sp.]|nr:DNA primase [Bacteroides sp.]MCM1477296.1 DNA primase [Bacteroides sp.]